MACVRQLQYENEQDAPVREQSRIFGTRNVLINLVEFQLKQQEKNMDIISTFFYDSILLPFKYCVCSYEIN